jgi:hypothetical protein
MPTASLSKEGGMSYGTANGGNEIFQALQKTIATNEFLRLTQGFFLIT